MNKKLICMVVSSLVLLGCANSNDRNNKNRSTMKEVHQKHQRNIFGHDLEKARSSWSQSILKRDTRGVSLNDDLRLPNPELEMTVFPARNEAGAVRPGYNMKFSMYEKVHYRIGY